MARMYSSRKGSSGSSKPYVTEAPAWSNTDKAAVEALVLDYAKAGHSNTKSARSCAIGMPSPMLVCARPPHQRRAERSRPCGQLPRGHDEPMRRAAGLIDHMGSNHKDLHNRRG